MILGLALTGHITEGKQMQENVKTIYRYRIWKTEEGYKFNVTTAKRSTFGKSSLTGFWRQGRITIAGGISSENLPISRRTWLIDVLAAELNYDAQNNYSFSLNIIDLLSKHEAAR